MAEGKTQAEILKDAVDVLELADAADLEPLRGSLLSLLARQFYVPSKTLRPRLRRLQELMDSLAAAKKKRKKTEERKATRQATEAEAGALLEEVAGLVFRGVTGWQSIENFESPTSQIDLFVKGTPEVWKQFMQAVGAPDGDVLIECKAYTSAVGITDFRRFCDLIDKQFGSVKLGVLFAFNGATGMPKRAKRTECVRHCWLAQVVFFVRTGVPVVVLDGDDILALDQPEAFTNALRSHITELKTLRGQPGSGVPGVVRCEGKHVADAVDSYLP